MTRKTYLEIKWSDPKAEYENPKGVFEVRRISPLSKAAIVREIERQTEKLKSDIHAS